MMSDIYAPLRQLVNSRKYYDERGSPKVHYGNKLWWVIGVNESSVSLMAVATGEQRDVELDAVELDYMAFEYENWTLEAERAARDVADNLHNYLQVLEVGALPNESVQ